MFSLQSAAATCGLYQAEEFTDRVLYTLTDFETKSKLTRPQTQFTITNSDTVLVRNMIRGKCYCVDGPVSPDPEFSDDENYQLIVIEKIVSEFSGCFPGR